MKYENAVSLICTAILLLGIACAAFICQSAEKSEIQIMQDEFCHYCEMVEAGVWPDYKKAYDKYCPSECGTN